MLSNKDNMKSLAIPILMIALSGVPAFAENIIGGTVVNHVPASSGQYIGSPSLVIIPDGTYVASNDYFGPKSKEKDAAVTDIFISEDKGCTWSKAASIEGQFWSTLFCAGDDLYIIGTKRAHGNIVIRKSTDKGRTWTIPYDKGNGLLFEGEYHTAPVPVVFYGGRVWRAFEYATSAEEKWPERYSATVISAPLNSDLLLAENWRKSEILPSGKPYLDGKFRGWLEGNVVFDVKKKSLVDILRVHSPFTEKEYAAIVDINRKGTRLSFNPETGFVKFPGGSKKFTVRYDEKSGKYWTIVNYTGGEHSGIQADRVRCRLALASSPDLEHWYVNDMLIEHPDPLKHGFQYVDWQFEGNDIVYLVRTAYDDRYGGADNYHNANFLTFHRKRDFRESSENAMPYE